MKTKYLILMLFLFTSAAMAQAPPSKFDLRDVNGVNYVTTVKSQSGGTCWTHGVMAAMEGNLLITGNWAAAGEIGEPALAEYHLDWWNGFNQHNNDDKVPPTGGGLVVHQGGDYLVSAAYLARNEGAVRDIDGQSYNSPPLRYHPSYHYYYPRHIEWYVAGPNLVNIDTIKNKLMEHGVIGVCLCSSSSYIQGLNHYQPPSSTQDPNHAVAIVGWDDDRVTQAPKKGAWLTKNSWGTSWGDQGYFWISYYDKHCCQNPTMGAISFQDVEPQQYDHFYYHDYHGWRDTRGDITQAFNAFVSQSNPQNGKEVIRAISFYTTAENVTYTAKIYDTFSSGQLSNEMASVTGQFDHIGFHTVDLPSKVSLTPGNDFYVYLEVSGGGQAFDRTSDVPVLLGSDQRVIVESSASPGESFYYENGVWKDFYYQENTGNFCMKAITVEEPALIYDFYEGLPEGTYPPGLETQVDYNIYPGYSTYQSGTATLHYRFDSSSAYTAIPVTELGGGLFQATIPNTKPGDAPQFYFSAQSTGGETLYAPAGAPNDAYSFDVAFIEEVFIDTFDTHKGWTVQNINLDDGQWERGVPQGGGVRGDPATAHGGSGYCYLTDNVAGNSDVDGGPTILTSPTMDLSEGDANVSYWRWHNNDDDDDYFTVEVSNNNGATWKVVEQVKHTMGWINHGFKVSDFVTPNGQVKVRFSSIDQPNNSVTESGLDDFMVRRFITDASLWGDGYEMSAAVGGIIHYSMDAGAINANRPYLVFTTFSGTKPGFDLPGGLNVPINWDAMTTFALNALGSPMFLNFMGTLNGSGQATASLNSFGPLIPAMIGMDMHLAYLLGPGLVWDFVSNAVGIHFIP